MRLRCKLGFHVWKDPVWLITTGTMQCAHCNAQLCSSMFGEFVRFPDQKTKDPTP